MGELSGGVFGKYRDWCAYRDPCPRSTASCPYAYHLVRGSRGGVGAGGEKEKKTRKMTPDHSARLAQPQRDAGDLLLSVLYLTARGFITMKYRPSYFSERKGGNKSCLEQRWKRS